MMFRCETRSYGESFFDSIVAKIRKVVKGSSRPPPPPERDPVLEEMFERYPERVPYDRRWHAKGDYMQQKSHHLYIEKNKRIRKLHKKITGDVYDTHDFANRT